MDWISRAAAQDFPQAQLRLALFYLLGKEVAQDDVLGFQLCQKAASAGIPYAAFLLGWLYQQGRGVFKDREQAMHWYRQAAEKNLPGAQLNLGLMYLYADGQSSDYQEAARWLREAAEQGYASAEFALAGLYLMGWGVTKSDETAFAWYLKAARQGHAQALTNTGLLYANGRGTPRNVQIGVLLFLLAEKAGDSNASRYSKTARNNLTAADFAKISQIADKWHPGMPLPEEYQHLMRAESEPSPALVADLKPIIIPSPDYPDSALLLTKETTVTIYAVIAPSGQVKSIKVHTSSGVPELDMAAAAAAWKAAFEPYLEQGKPTTVAVLIPYHFKPDDPKPKVRRPQGIQMTLTDTRSIGERIKSNIAFEVPPDWQRNDPAEYAIVLFPDGSVRDITLLSSSGLPNFDVAVRRSIEKSQPFPMAEITGSPPRFVLKSRPLESQEAHEPTNKNK